jgi:NADPH-dependent 2,4-dienoyl-CoA reductase/sulfur reductase-like enzyme
LKSRNIKKAWIGVYSDNSNNFITVGGVNVSYTNWYTNEPDIYTLDCVVVVNIVTWTPNYGAALGRWDDQGCKASTPYYVCELKAQP